MATPPLPTPAQLGAPGLYSLPIAETCSGLVLSGGQLPIRTLLGLTDGTELLLSMSDIAAERLYSALKGLFEPPPDRIRGRPIRVHRISELPTPQWDDDNLHLDFLHEDGATTVLAIPTQMLEPIRKMIGAAIAERR
jgi:hypothetical protein